MFFKRILTAAILTAAASLLPAGELPPELQAKLLKIIANGAGSAGKVACKDDALKAALEGQGMAIDGMSKVAWSNQGPEIRTLKAMGKLVVCGKLELLQQGASIALVEDGGRPKIVMNPANIKASGVQLSDAILKAASL